MKLNPETLARATSRHPWSTIGVWVLVIVVSGVLSSRLLSDVLTDDMAFQNDPESARAAAIVNQEFAGGGTVGAESTEFLVVSSAEPWDESAAAFVRELEADVAALEPDVIAPAVVTYADAEAMASQLFTPDDHGVLIALQLRGDPAAAIAELSGPVADATPVGFESQILTAEQLASLGGAEAAPATEGPQAFVLVTHPVATWHNLQFLNAVRDLETVVTRRAGPNLAAPPFSGFDADQQASSLISTDGRTTLVTVPIVDMSEEIVAELREVAAAASNDAYDVQVAGQAAMFADFMKIAEEDMGKSERTGLLVALIVLVIVFGALVAACCRYHGRRRDRRRDRHRRADRSAVPALDLRHQHHHDDRPGGRHRLLAVRRRPATARSGGRGLDKHEAIAAAGGTASRAVVFSGMTVVIALLGMFIVPTRSSASLGARRDRSSCSSRWPRR